MGNGMEIFSLRPSARIDYANQDTIERSSEEESQSFHSIAYLGVISLSNPVLRPRARKFFSRQFPVLLLFVKHFGKNFRFFFSENFMLEITK